MVYHKTPEGYKIKRNIPVSLRQIKIKDMAQNSQRMKKLSLDMKDFLELPYIHLPVHDIPVLHALGVTSDISWEQGIKLKEEPYDDIEDLKNIELDYKRLNTLFQVIKELKEEGETVFIEIPGIYTTLSALIPFDKVIQSTKNLVYEEITDKVLLSLKNYVKKLDNLQVDFIYYSDELSRLDIVGTRFYKKHYARLAKEILELSKTLNYAQLSIGKHTFEAMKTLDILESNPTGKIHTQEGCYELLEKESGKHER